MSHLARRCLPPIVWVGISLVAAMSAAADAGQSVTGNVGQVVRSDETTGPAHLPVPFESPRPSEATPVSPPYAGEPPGPGDENFRDAAPSSDATTSVPFPARGEERLPGNTSYGPPKAGRAMVTAVGSLGLVLVVFFLFVWATRKAAPQSMAQLPPEVVESLGRTPLAGRQQMHLVRVGTKLILLSVTSTETRALTEITDAAEVDRLAGLCQQNRPGSITATFRQVLSDAGQDSRSRTRRPRGPSPAGERAHAR